MKTLIRVLKAVRVVVIILAFLIVVVGCIPPATTKEGENFLRVAGNFVNRHCGPFFLLIACLLFVAFLARATLFFLRNKQQANALLILEEQTAAQFSEIRMRSEQHATRIHNLSEKQHGMEKAQIRDFYKRKECIREHEYALGKIYERSLFSSHYTDQQLYAIVRKARKPRNDALEELRTRLFD